MEEKYSHTDLYGCAFMIAKGVDILSVEKINDYSSRFVMACDMETGKDLYRRYRENEAIGVLDLKYALRRAKDILFNKEDNAKP